MKDMNAMKDTSSAWPQRWGSTGEAVYTSRGFKKKIINLRNKKLNALKKEVVDSSDV